MKKRSGTTCNLNLGKSRWRRRYDNASSWNQAHQDQDWSWQAQTTSTWQDENLLNGSADAGEAESISKEVLLEENSAASNIGLQIEEDDIEEQPDEDPSEGRPKIFEEKGVRQWLKFTSRRRNSLAQARRIFAELMQN